MAKKPTDDKSDAITWEIYPIDRRKQNITILHERGECLFIVGANGSGKSALIQQFVTELKYNKKIFFERYSAHRKPWFDRQVIITARNNDEREQSIEAMMTAEAANQARWYPTNDDAKHENIFDALIMKWEGFSNSIRSLHDSDKPIAEKISEEEKLEKENPLRNLNALLKQANIPIKIEGDIRDTNRLSARHIHNDSDVKIQEMSDGERFAFLFAVTAVAMRPGSVLLIDEPEIHLHQSIIEPFLSALIASRKDCFFVFSTHNIALPSARSDSKVIIVRSCEWAGDAPSRFDAKLLEPDTPIPEDIREYILGAREKILFVEGSLDTHLYKRLFPEFRVIPQGGISNVYKAVKGVRETAHLHHTEAYGLVDRDMRSEKQIRDNLKNNIGVLGVWSVESLYYSTEAIDAVLKHQIRKGVIPRITSTDPRSGTTRTKRSFLPRSSENPFLAAYRVLSKEETAKIVAVRRTKWRIRENVEQQRKIMESVINDEEMLESPPIQTHTVDIAKIYSDELKDFETLLKSSTESRRTSLGLMATELERKWTLFLSAYPLHNTDAFHAIARAFKLTEDSYIDTLLSLVQEDEELAEKLRGYIQMPPALRI